MIGLAIWAGCAWLGATIGTPKNRRTQGFWLGVLLGPIGVIVICVLPPVTTPPRPSQTTNARPPASHSLPMTATAQCYRCGVVGRGFGPVGQSMGGTTLYGCPKCLAKRGQA